MPMVFYSGVSADQLEKLAAIDGDGEKLVSLKLGKKVVWTKTKDGNVRLAVMADSSVLLELSSVELAGIAKKKLLEKIANSLPAELPKAVDPPVPKSRQKLKYKGIYIYVDGSDLDKVAVRLERQLKAFLTKSWIKARFINDKSERTPDLAPQDLPQWNLGLNFDRTDVNRKVLQRALIALGEIAAKTGREFVIGYYARGIDWT